MASRSVLGASAAASSVVASATSSSNSTAAAAPQRCPGVRAVAFRLAARPKLPLFSSKACKLSVGNRRSCAVLVKSQKTEVVSAPTKSSLPVDLKPELPKDDGAEPPAKEATTSQMSEVAVSEFMNQVASLVKLVDSRDIVELQLKQQDYELVIRKKEALPQTPPPSSFVLAQPHAPPAAFPQQFLPQQPPAPAATTPGAATVSQTPTPAAASSKSSLPPVKSPMAGTFYRSPGPGQPAFVKVGDKVNKGQVLCIIEAMKLMNEIEADQAGTIAEILSDDAKPVSVDQPLFLIEP
ncbi:hypothetical protein Taro_011096 [Colocasia esculenta]|uniref:Biotin carboxyl carrier protein of acetyl-CoA carboxylase n=1 Tax=Colocasia esculenta TaxID=4460 RepID=A0A843U9N4_COLES|nr:hypothetical protein [Colocasia esculenta]